MYKITLEISGEKLVSEGKDMFEAVEGLGLSWKDVKNKGIFTITDGKNKVEKLFVVKQLRRFAANKITRLMWAKFFHKLLKAES